MDLEGKSVPEITAGGSQSRLELPQRGGIQRGLAGAAKVSIDARVWQLKTANCIVATEVGKHLK